MAIYLGTNQISYSGTNGGYMINGHLILTKTYTFNLGQTNYSSLTPSTTAQSLTLFTTDYTTTAGTTIKCYRIGEAYDGIIIDRNMHDYVIFFECITNYNYGSNNVSSTIHTIKTAHTRDYQEGKYWSGINSSTGTINYTATPSKNASNITTLTPTLYQKADNTDAFTTTSDFVEGAGKSYPAGTNIVCINTATSGTAVYKWDVLTGMVDLSGYQPLIDSSNKLSADLVDDTSTTNKFVTTADKTNWNGTLVRK